MKMGESKSKEHILNQVRQANDAGALMGLAADEGTLRSKNIQSLISDGSIRLVGWNPVMGSGYAVKDHPIIERARQLATDEYDRSKEAALKDITHGTDGPVTAFVVIARAIELARRGKFPPMNGHDPVANVLSDILEKNFGLVLE